MTNPMKLKPTLADVEAAAARYTEEMRGRKSVTIRQWVANRLRRAILKQDGVDGQDDTNVSSGTPTLNETGHSYNEADHDGIMQPVDPADFDRELIDARGLLDELQRAWNDQCRERNNGDPDPWIRKSYTTIEAQSATMESFADALEEIAEAEWPVDDAVARIKRLASRVLATKGGVSDPEARD